jgi:hypothetical protein
LHHDNAPAHTALSLKVFLANKKLCWNRHFDDIDDIRINTTAALKAIPQNQFQNYFEG